MTPRAILPTAVATLALALAGCAAPRSATAVVTPETIRPPVATGLDTLVRMKLPDNLPNVEAAARFVLRGSGYAFTTYCAHCPPKAPTIAKEPVSPLAYTGGITTVRRALLLVGGSKVRLVVDDRAKLVTYDEMAAL